MSAWILGPCFVLGAMLLGYLPAELLRRRYRGPQSSDTRAVASDVMARIGVMHGLILSLVFASAHNGAQRFEDDVVLEASAATHVYFNAQRIGSEPLQAGVRAYLQAAVDRDWPSLIERNELSDEGWIAWRRMLDASLALRPADRREQLLADKIQADVWQVETLRQARGFEAGARLSGEFWLVAVVGLVLISTLLFTHQVNALHQGLMAMYSGFTGLTLFLIYDLSHPFNGAITVGPEAFVRALAMIGSGV